MARICTIATCALNQWAMDFEGNYRRILESITIAKAKGASYRLGPELEVCGYGCNDHFYENDTFTHCWEVLAKILADKSTHGIFLDIGMPVMLNGVRYNCRILCYNGEIKLIRPKLFLANDGNYREGRWFTAWSRLKQIVVFKLPKEIVDITGQKTTIFGDAILSFNDVRVGIEVCEELFTPQNPHIQLGLDGVEIFCNGSASHFELRKLKRRIDLITHAMSKNGGVYLYANYQGCDGERVYYDGTPLIVSNDVLLAQGSQFSLCDVEVITATVNLDEVSSYRASIISRSSQAALQEPYPCIYVDIYLCDYEPSMNFKLTKPIKSLIREPEQEISFGISCWLWDYLRRSGSIGFFLPLSGGIDSGCVSLIVYNLCELLSEYVSKKDQLVLNDLERILGCPKEHVPSTAKDLCSRLLHTCYMATENSSSDTRLRATKLAGDIGSYHLQCDIDGIVGSFLSLVEMMFQKKPKYKVFGGSNRENLALQNLQARSRMVLSYLLAQLLPWIRDYKSSGGLLVLGAGNVDESLRGYFTKYDCSSADLNPIGSVSKIDIKRFVDYYGKKHGFASFQSLVEAPPTAELEPLTESHKQNDEDDMGMTYAELSVFGKLRKMSRCGPVSMFLHAVSIWPQRSLQDIASKIKRFFFYYSVNRHKMTTLTPALHAEAYSPDDNRFDLRPFLYHAKWSWQFSRIDEILAKLSFEKVTQ